MNNEKLVQHALENLEKAYVPYSNFPVSSAIKLKSGEIIDGVNVENASFGATICAERNAITSAITKGYKKGDFEKIAIVSNSLEPTIPCAICLQVLSEFLDDDTELLLANKKGKYIIKTLDDLLPYRFTETELKNV